MISSLQNGEEQYYDFKNGTTELFYDAPIDEDKVMAITAYLGHFDTDIGLNYIRNFGANHYTILLQELLLIVLVTVF
jgi:hypothetical protein